jgi:hypothetical protein
VVLVDGVVVRTSPSLPPRPVASCDEVWLGQPIERVLPCFGRLLSVLTTSALVELTFAATILQVHEGRVVHISARPVTAAS